MRRRVLILAFVGSAFVALAADEPGPPSIDVELNRGQAVATIAAESLAATGTLGVLLWRPFRRWRRRVNRDRLEAEAMMAAEARKAEDRRIDERLATALATFRKTVVDANIEASARATRAILEDHAAEAHAQMITMSMAIQGVAQTVAGLADRVEDKVDGVNGRIDDFLTALAAGNVPHFRALPRPKEDK